MGGGEKDKKKERDELVDVAAAKRRAREPLQVLDELGFKAVLLAETPWKVQQYVESESFAEKTTQIEEALRKKNRKDHSLWTQCMFGIEKDKWLPGFKYVKGDLSFPRSELMTLRECVTEKTLDHCLRRCDDDKVELPSMISVLLHLLLAKPDRSFKVNPASKAGSVKETSWTALQDVNPGTLSSIATESALFECFRVTVLYLLQLQCKQVEAYDSACTQTSLIQQETSFGNEKLKKQSADLKSITECVRSRTLLIEAYKKMVDVLYRKKQPLVACSSKPTRATGTQCAPSCLTSAAQEANNLAGSLVSHVETSMQRLVAKVATKEDIAASREGDILRVKHVIAEMLGKQQETLQSPRGHMKVSEISAYRHTRLRLCLVRKSLSFLNNSFRHWKACLLCHQRQSAIDIATQCEQTKEMKTLAAVLTDPIFTEHFVPSFEWQKVSLKCLVSEKLQLEYLQGTARLQSPVSGSVVVYHVTCFTECCSIQAEQVQHKEEVSIDIQARWSVKDFKQEVLRVMGRLDASTETVRLIGCPLTEHGLPATPQREVQKDHIALKDLDLFQNKPFLQLLTNDPPLLKSITPNWCEKQEQPINQLSLLKKRLLSTKLTDQNKQIQGLIITRDIERLENDSTFSNARTPVSQAGINEQPHYRNELSNYGYYRFEEPTTPSMEPSVMSQSDAQSDHRQQQEEVFCQYTESTTDRTGIIDFDESSTTLHMNTSTQNTQEADRSSPKGPSVKEKEGSKAARSASQGSPRKYIDLAEILAEFPSDC